MSLKTKLQNWQTANLISSDQAAAIAQYETENHKGIFKGSLTYIAIFSILLGISLIIGANWQDIPDTIKLVAHFTVNIILSVLIYRWRDNPARALARDIALFLLWGLTLTLIALIGQVFQLSGNTWDATRLWFFITTPMMLLLAQGRYLTALWGTFFALYIPFDIAVNVIDNLSPQAAQTTAFVSLFTLLPPALYFAAPYMRPNMGITFKNLSWFMALGAATISSFPYYNHSEFLQSGLYAQPIAAVVIAALLYLRTKWDKTFTDIFILSTLFIAIPLVLPFTGELTAMLHTVLLWMGAGYIFQRDGHYKMLNLAIIIITLRLFIGFLELFGSMMMSGFGFILMGLLLMTLIYAARRIKQVLTA